jgi:hypothetical protein
MNYPRVALGAVAGTIADFAYGFLVYGNLLTGSFLSQTGIYRTAGAQMAYMPYGAAGIFVAMIAATITYARGTGARRARRHHVRRAARPIRDRGGGGPTLAGC